MTVPFSWLSARMTLTRSEPPDVDLVPCLRSDGTPGRTVTCRQEPPLLVARAPCRSARHLVITTLPSFRVLVFCCSALLPPPSSTTSPGRATMI